MFNLPEQMQIEKQSKLLEDRYGVRIVRSEVNPFQGYGTAEYQIVHLGTGKEFCITISREEQMMSPDIFYQKMYRELSKIEQSSKDVQQNQRDAYLGV